MRFGVVEHRCTTIAVLLNLTAFLGRAEFFS